MEKYQQKFTTIDHIRRMTEARKPDFNNIIQALQLKTPSRPTLMELFMNNALFSDVLGEPVPDDPIAHNQFTIRAFRALGYDYATIPLQPGMRFESKPHVSKESISLNDEPMITDEATFDQYIWPDFANMDYSYLSQDHLMLPDGMKGVCIGPGGVLENLISLLGYDNMCIMIYENPQLVKRVADRIGETLLGFYQCCVSYDTIGACYVNDDWGFNTQTMISPDQMREYIIPWHQKITKVIHDAGKYAIMHSCGMLWEVMDDIVNDIQSDAKHSYEDNITPVEEAYDRMKSRICVVGGIDVDFMCRKSPEEIYNRAVALLEQTQADGGYILGTGNSVPEYIPRENYFALVSAAVTNTYDA